MRGSELYAAPLEQKGLSRPGGGGDDTLSQHSSSGAQGDEKSKSYRTAWQLGAGTETNFQEKTINERGGGGGVGGGWGGWGGPATVIKISFSLPSRFKVQ